MRNAAGNLVRSMLRHMGHQPAPEPQAGATPDLAARYREAVEQLAWCKTMRDIRKRDCLEIEQLYRRFVFHDLPEREARAADLNGLIGTTVSEAIYIIQSLHRALQGPGDICEFGVAQGATSRLLAGEIMATDRHLWLYDSFEGLPAPTEEDLLIDDIFALGSMDEYRGTMKCARDEVVSKLRDVGFPMERVHIREGWVEETTRTGEIPQTIAFAYVDLDLYAPIKAALEFMDPRMPQGARVVVDDYGFFSEGAQKAVDEFVADTKGRFKFSLPLEFAGNFALLEKLDP